jgi:hypothetical protein
VGGLRVGKHALQIAEQRRGRDRDSLRAQRALLCVQQRALQLDLPLKLADQATDPFACAVLTLARRAGEQVGPVGQGR